MARAKSNMQSRQVCAARALLDWTQEELAKAAQVSVATIRLLELGRRPRPETWGKIHNSLAGRGLELVEPGGVRYLPDGVSAFQGEQGLAAFFDDVYRTSGPTSTDIVVVGTLNSPLLPLHPAHATFYRERLKRPNHVAPTKCIVTGSSHGPQNVDGVHYRSLPPQTLHTVSFCVYGQKCALPIAGDDRALRIVVIQSPNIAASYRQHFQSLWDRASSSCGAKPQRGEH